MISWICLFFDWKNEVELSSLLNYRIGLFAPPIERKLGHEILKIISRSLEDAICHIKHIENGRIFSFSKGALET